MKIQTFPYFLEFNIPFKLAHGERKGTDLVFVRIEHEGIMGWGEASLPPYRKETTSSVEKWIKENSEFSLPKEFLQNNSPLDIPFSNENPAASAALEMAVFDWYCHSKKIALKELFDTGNHLMGLSLTITKNDFDFIKKKLQLAENFTDIKLKLTGSDDDLDFVKAIRKLTDKRFAIDFNQAHNKAENAIKIIEQLEKEYCSLIEQPLKDNNHDGHYWLKQRTKLPIVADESIQNMDDLLAYHDAYSGVNVKLMKCGGLIRAFQMIQKIDEYKMLKLIGCMSESSLAVAAASVLAPLCIMADLDSPYLNKNNPFEGFEITRGIITLKGNQGLAVNRKNVL